MIKCTLCRRETGSHDPACPEVSEDKQKAVADNQRGYRDGMSGKGSDDAETPAYKLGWRSGVVALEEYENGHDPRFY